MKTTLPVFYRGCIFIAMLLANGITSTAQCSSDFSFDVNDSTNTAHFTNLSVPLSEDAYYWQFGDNTTTAEKDPLHVYINKGTYKVCLIRKDPVCYDTVCKMVQVLPDSCALNFTFITEPKSAKVSFFNHSAGTPDAFVWIFGDLTSTAGQRDVVHNYTFNNMFNVCLIRKDMGSNCPGMICKSLLINLDSCHVNFSTSIDQETKTVTCYNTSHRLPNTDFTWDFGDGGSSLGSSPVHSYAALGIYKICLVKNDAVCTDSTCNTVVLDGRYPCSASFSHQEDSTNHKLIRFDNLSKGRNLSYNWSVEPGGVTSSTKDFSYLFPQDGYYDVCLTVQESDSFCSSRICNRILIYFDTIGCRVAFTYEISTDSIAHATAVTFFNQSSNRHKINAWNFGDGATSSDRSPSHRYTGNGAFTVCLTIYDTLIHCTDTMCSLIQITSDTTTGLNNAACFYKLELYPVPLTDKFHVNFVTINEELVTVRITSILGATSLLEIKQVKPGINTFEINSGTFPEGIYFVELSSTAGTVMRKVVK